MPSPAPSRPAAAPRTLLRRPQPLPAALVPAAGQPSPAVAPALEPADWDSLQQVLDQTLHALRPDTGWLARLTAVRQGVLRLADARPDAALLHLVWTAGHDPLHYSSRHGLLCALVAREAASGLDWPVALQGSLVMAALTMNAAMHGLQDELALAPASVTPAVRQHIATHAEQAAHWLVAAGVADSTWIEVVRLHHDDSQAHRPLGQLDPVQRAARLLHRVDMFIAMLSCREGRAPMSPVQAARKCCLGADGTPDEIGAALLQAVGLYPPGSCVRLASGEAGVVVGRGPRANLPRVAVVQGADGAPLPQPVLRQPHDRRFQVRGPLASHQLQVVPPLSALLALA